MSETGLRIALTNWKGVAPPVYVTTAICTYDFYTEPFFYPLLNDYVIGIIFVGSYRGIIGRLYIMVNGDVKFMGFQFGHNSKIVSLQPCSFPVIVKALCSLSHDGTICVWDILDGICVAKYEHLLPEGCQKIVISQHNYEIAAISGSFPNVYIVNIVTGEIINRIPVSNCNACLSSIATDDNEWLMISTAKGTVIFISLADIRTTNYFKVRLFDIQEILPSGTSPSDSLILQAILSPKNDFCVLIFPSGYAVVSLTLTGFPSMYFPLSGVASAVWTSDTCFYVMQMNGDLKCIACSTDGFTPAFSSFGEYIEKTYEKSKKHQDTIEEDAAAAENAKEKVRIVKLECSDLNPLADKPLVMEVDDKTAPAEQKAPRSGETAVLAEEIGTIEGVEIFCPVASVFNKGIVLGYRSKVLVEMLGFQEVDIVSSFESASHFTVQNFLCEKDEIVASLFGNDRGEIIVRYHSGQPERCIKAHTQRITALISTHGFIISASEDCTVRIYDIQANFEQIDEISIFIAPVCRILTPSKKTHTAVDHYVFCVSRNNVVAVYSLKERENVFVLSGHDSEIQNMYFHPGTMMLVVETKSLYLWSLHTGNLESVMTGQQKDEYLKDTKQFILIEQHLKLSGAGVQLRYVTLGGLSVFVQDIDVKELAKHVEKTLLKHADEPFEAAMKSCRNLSTICELLPHTVASLKTMLKTFAAPSDLTFAFIGAKGALSMWAPGEELTGDSVWRVSSITSAIIFAIHAKMIHALRANKEFAEKFNVSQLIPSPTEFAKYVKNYVRPSLLHVILRLSSVSDNESSFIIDLINSYTEEQKIEWLKKMRDAFDRMPRIKSLFSVVYAGIASTLHKIPEDRIKEIVTIITRLLMDEKVCSFVFEILKHASKEVLHEIDSKEIIEIMTEISGVQANDGIEQFVLQYITLRTGEFIEATKKLAKEKNPLALVFIHHLLKALERRIIDAVSICSVMVTVLECIELTDTDQIVSELIEMGRRLPFFEYNKEKSECAYGTKNGNVIFVQKRNTDFISSNVAVGKSPIDAIYIERDGTLITAVTDDHSAIAVYNIAQQEQTMIAFSLMPLSRQEYDSKITEFEYKRVGNNRRINLKFENGKKEVLRFPLSKPAPITRAKSTSFLKGYV